MEAATDPQRFCAHLLNHATLRGVIIAFDYALRIGDPSLTDTVYNSALEVARQVEPWPLTPDGKWALHGHHLVDLASGTPNSRLPGMATAGGLGRPPRSSARRRRP